jgi:hypothetical protein
MFNFIQITFSSYLGSLGSRGTEACYVTLDKFLNPIPQFLYLSNGDSHGNLEDNFESFTIGAQYIVIAQSFIRT